MRSPLLAPAVAEAWFDTLRPQQQPTVRLLRRTVLEAAPSLTPVVKWGNLVFMHRGRHALAIVVHRDHIHLQVFNGAALAGRYPMLGGGGGRDVRYLRLSYETPLDAGLVRGLTVDAVASMG